MVKNAVPREVDFVMSDGPHSGDTRPAVVVRSWEGNDPPLLNLVVFVDGTNDGYPTGQLSIWRTSVKYSEDGTPGTWHYQEV